MFGTTLKSFSSLPVDSMLCACGVAASSAPTAIAPISCRIYASSEIVVQRLGVCPRNDNGDYGENGCTGGTEKRRTNGEDQKLTRSIEDQLSSPFNLRCSVSPVNPCPPHPPCPRQP